MKTFYRLLTMGLLIATLNNFVSATPSTQIWMPSTDVQAFGVFHLGWDSYIKTESNPSPTEAFASPFGYGPTVTNGGITVGVLPFKQVGLEVGVDYRDINAYHQYPIYLNAKLGTPEDAFFKYQPAIAIGSFDLGTHYSGNLSPTNYNVTYGLIAKNFWKLGRVSLGYYKGNDNLLVDVTDNKKDANGVLVSWDRTLTEISDKLWLAVEYMGAKNSYGEASIGGSYAITPDASFIIGYDYWNDYNSYRPTVTVQVDLNLPAVQDWFKKAEKK
jgi:hypothetical protein